jgi:hypothetical protein
MMKAKEKDDTMPSSSCLRGMKTRGGENDDN